MVRHSESKGWELGIVCERIKLTTIVIKLRKTVKWIKTREGCCVPFGITTI